MIFEAKNVKQTINSSFRREPVERASFEEFKAGLEKLLSGMEQADEAGEREEHFKNLLPPFFKSAGFGAYKINTSSNIGLAIYTGSKTRDPLGVMMEVKRPSNHSEMISPDRLNRKAMHEAVLYYLEQRISERNTDLKHVIITNMTSWFIFDAQEFERCFYRPPDLKNAYKDWKANRKVSSNTDFMYQEIAKFIGNSDNTIRGVNLPLESVRKLLKGERDSAYEKRLISLYKFFSPTHLLKEPFANDSNSLNRDFYRELLYILGLEETKQGNTRYIKRTEEKNRQPGSIMENTIRILDTEGHLYTLQKELHHYGSDRNEQIFGVAMELAIIWMNRILFLKLLEAQLYQYHRKDNRFKFLSFKSIQSFDELNKLFFQVLARKSENRTPDVVDKFGHIPYLNSSLFDLSAMERKTLRISGLDGNVEMEVSARSVLTSERGNRLHTLDYLFRFLDAYDFSAEGTEEIRDERKTLINASVLGLIFEKINGYKDGSFYTPGFITEYMARETLRKAVSDKFASRINGGNREEMGELTMRDIHNYIGREISITEANDLINSITICDPAVGSGHFLVSCLNELIAIKSELRILCDTDGKLLYDVIVEVQNDELIITWRDDELFEYDVNHTWRGDVLSDRRVSAGRHRVQQALFHEKRYLIENCLFGVDINPNSVKICRLRLWIELLKRAFYTQSSDFMELEVLPNIDINIKRGNSLVSRFELDSDLTTVFNNSKHSLEDYKQAVRSYKQSGDRTEKNRLQQLIEEIKSEYSTTLYNNSPINKKLSRARGRLEIMTSDDLFGKVEFTAKQITAQKKRVKQLEQKKTEEESGEFYNEAFEWRFEFPEVLDDEGLYIGFDVIIGNPPYGRFNMFSNDERQYLKQKGLYGKTGDIAEVFINLVLHNLSKYKTQFSFIVPKGLSYVKSWSSVRASFLNGSKIYSIIDTSSAFDEALYEMLIFHIEKNENQSSSIKTGYLTDEKQELFQISSSRYSENVFYLGFSASFFPLLEKLNDNSIPLSKKYNFWYGKGGMTPKINKDGVGIEVLTGKEVQRFYIKDIKNKWHIEDSYLSDVDLRRANKRKVVAQDIVAHVKNPSPHIKLTATIDENQQFCLNTVMCFSEIEGNKLSNEFLIGLINSKLLSFYYYYFIFNQAIRTMHFMPGYSDRLPIHANSSTYHDRIVDKVNLVLDTKKQDPNSDTSALEAEIDRLVYQLYELTEEEIEIVEGNTHH